MENPLKLIWNLLCSIGVLFIIPRHHDGTIIWKQFWEKFWTIIWVAICFGPTIYIIVAQIFDLR